MIKQSIVDILKSVGIRTGVQGASEIERKPGPIQNGAQTQHSPKFQKHLEDIPNPLDFPSGMEPTQRVTIPPMPRVKRVMDGPNFNLHFINLTLSLTGDPLGGTLALSLVESGYTNDEGECPSILYIRDGKIFLANDGEDVCEFNVIGSFQVPDSFVKNPTWVRHETDPLTYTH